MEVLGAGAATGQLIGTANGILDSISQLRDFLRHAPEQHKGWNTELTVLGDIIARIVDNSALHTCQVKCIIESMAPKIATLKSLFSRYIPQPKKNFISRLNSAFSARTVESRILQTLESLEHDKTALLLTISTLNELISARSSLQTSAEPEEPKEDKNHRTSYSVSSQPLVPMQDLIVTNTTIQGSDTVIFNTTGTDNYHLDNFKMIGDRTLIGNHPPGFANNWLESVYPSQSSIHASPSGQNSPGAGVSPKGS